MVKTLQRLYIYIYIYIKNFVIGDYNYYFSKQYEQNQNDKSKGEERCREEVEDKKNQNNQ